MVEYEALRFFLIEAHAQTYASDTSKPVDPTRLGSTDYEYSSLIRPRFRYHDSYFGGRRFIGEEVVYFDQKPVWGMNYYGYVIKESMDHKAVYSFLKKALRVGIEDGMPLRGPDMWVTEIFKYIFILEGSPQRFSGLEEIFFKGELVYKAFVHGGWIES